MLTFCRACLITSAMLLVPAAAAAEERPKIEFTKDSLECVKKNVAKKKAVLVDVRSKEEWNEGHIKGSIFLPVTSLRKHSFDAEKVAKTLPKQPKSKQEKGENKNEPKILYTFCVVGMRAKQAGIVLERMGYKVRVLKPGYEELVEAGFEVDRTPLPDEVAERDAE